MDTMDAHVKNRLLASFPDRFLQLLLGFADDLLNPAGMDSPVRNELLQRQPRDLPANRIMARNDHGLRCIIDNQIDSCRGLESSDVASLSTDDFSFQLIVGQRHYRHRPLRNKITGEPLDG